MRRCWYDSVCSNKVEGCENSCIRYIKMNYLVDASLLGENQCETVKLIADEVDLDAFNNLKAIKEDIANHVSQGHNLLIYSKITGNGKTEWAKRLLLSYFDSIWHSTDLVPRGLFIYVPRFFNQLKESINGKQEYIEQIKSNVLNADLVVWDEIGVKNLSNYEHDYLVSYINERVANGKANIFTSNLDDKELFEVLGDRLYSRVVNSSKLIEFKGIDKRGLKKW